MAKDYPLRIETLVEFESGGNIIAYYTKGHHDPQTFADLVVREHEIPDWVDFEINVFDVEQVWARSVPTTGDCDFIQHPAKAGARGAYPITRIDFHNASLRRAYQQAGLTTTGTTK